MLLLYRISIGLYAVIVYLMAPFHDRARKFVRSRRGLMSRLKQDMANRTGRLIWFHAASVGEFEQAKPLIHAFKERHADMKVLVTFFSPAGAEAGRRHQDTDFVHLLPLDSPGNAREFIQVVQPDLAIFIKYEFWYYFLTELHKAKVPVMLISGIFRRNQMFFHPMGSFYLNAFKSIRYYFLQDSISGALLRKVGIRNFSIVGDTRYDRVVQVASWTQEFESVQLFCEGARVMVLGSIWPTDLIFLKRLVQSQDFELKYIVSPHVLNAAMMAECAELGVHAFYSEHDERKLRNARILIVDQMGLLSQLYRYAAVAYVGGAFRGALHNVLEAAVYGIPVFFGKNANNEKFIEAVDLEAAGGAFSFNDEDDMLNKLDELLDDEAYYSQVCEISENFVKSRTGATEQIMKKIESML